ncbi:ABC transporter permease [Bordetella petrii]|uniref:ABC transporter permease n=1 Tax=Bordetella petrii TaxID=94624 RepID=UPI001A95AEC4|nr:ABC transporter permease [Bordetella petrii]MBO1110556.1 ABC transporter permease [Bordetella petrii]
MLRFALRRLGLAVLVALTVSFATFVLLNVATDPAQAIAGENAEPELVEQIRHEYGFDRPFMERYGNWLSHAVRGDFGKSYYWHDSVSQLVAKHAPPTIRLALMAVVITVLLAIPLGVAAALRPNSALDRFSLGVAVSAQAIPNFWLGLVLVILFSVMIPVFPVSGDGTWLHYVLPALVLGTSSVPAVMRLTRAGLIEVMGSDYVRTARAKGYRGVSLLLRHAMRNAMLPIVSVLAVQLGQKFGGSVIVESIFAINGLGRLTLQSILGSDIPTVQMLIFIFALVFIVMNFLADVLNALLDPRIRMG